MISGDGERARRGWLVAVLVAALLGGGRAAATTTFTPPLRNVESDEIACAVLNHSTQNVMVSAVLRAIDGTALESAAPTAVAPGDLESLIFNADAEAAAYCQFDFTGDDAAIRGFLLDFDSGNGNTRLLAAASKVSGPAQPDVTVHSPPVVSGPSDLVACIAQNVGIVTVEVTARLRNSSGGLLAESTTDLDAFQVRTIVSASDPPGATYCEFLFDGNPTVLRAYARISDNMGGNTRFLAAADQAAAAAAPTLHTAAIAPDGGTVHCAAQNLDDQAVMVDADLLDADGAVIASASDSVQPGDVAFLTNTAAESAAPVSCRFTVDGAGPIVRPFAALIEPAGGLRLLELAGTTDGPAGLGATSHTPPLRSVDGSEIECWLHNLTAAPVEIDAALVNPSGGIVTARQATVQAGDVRRIVHSTDLLFGAHCRFTFTGSPASIRGHIVLNDGSPRLLHAASIALPLTPLPTATSTATRTATRTPTATPSFTATHTPTATPTATATSAPTAMPSSTATHTPTAVPTGSATRTPTATPAPAAAGDANCDGTISAADLTAAVAAIASGAVPVCGEDANQDGVVDAADLERITALMFGTAPS